MVGEYVYFGRYKDIHTNYTSSIRWKVLEVKDGKALLISECGLDCKPYNSVRENVTWATCSLRTWLNETFLHSAFFSSERESIVRATLPADSNPQYGRDTDPGDSTEDYVFILSLSEIEQYFYSDSHRRCFPTNYAVLQGAYENPEWKTCWYWLRTPGMVQQNAATVNSDGSINYEGGVTGDNVGAVRPAIWVDVEALK